MPSVRVETSRPMTVTTAPAATVWQPFWWRTPETVPAGLGMAGCAEAGPPRPCCATGIGSAPLPAEVSSIAARARTERTSRIIAGRPRAATTLVAELGRPNQARPGSVKAAGSRMRRTSAAGSPLRSTASSTIDRPVSVDSFTMAAAAA